MLKRSIILVAIVALCGCGESEQKKDQPTQDAFRTFMEYHDNACKCILDNMPDIKQVLQGEGGNSESLFCLWNSFMCAESKSAQTIQDSAQLIDNSGEFSCSLLERFSNIALEKNIDALCDDFWTTASVTYIHRLVHLTNTCTDFFDTDTDCICTVKGYIASISAEEHNALIQYGYAVLGKLKDAASRCLK